MGFVIPFDTAAESTNLFVKQDVAYTAEGKTPVSWNFSTMPSEEWKNVLGSEMCIRDRDCPPSERRPAR